MSDDMRLAAISKAGSAELDGHTIPNNGDIRCDMVANNDCDVLVTISALVTPGEGDLRLAFSVESEDNRGQSESVEYFHVDNRQSLLTLKRLIEIALDK